MKVATKYFLFFCFSLIAFTKAQSQVDTTFNKLLDSLNLDDLFGAVSKKSYFKFQTSYLTNYVYAGRKDTLTTNPYLTTTLEYNHKSGLYTSAGFSYLANDSQRIDVSNVELGYTINTAGKFGGTICVNKSFYNSNSNNVQSDIGWMAGLTLNYDAKFITVAAANYVMFGSGKDYSLTLSADHSFYIGNDKNYLITVTPTLSSYFGSTSFYQSRQLKRQTLGLPPGTVISKTSTAKFQQLSYELSLPISFDKSNWGLFINPTFAIPVNPIVISRKATTPSNVVIPLKSITETLSNSFFAEFGAYIKF